MASIGEQIIQGLKALADAVGKPTGLTVHRNRSMPLDREQYPALILYPASPTGYAERIDVSDHDPDSASRTLGIRAEIRCSNVDADAAELEADDIYVWVCTQFLADGALASLVESIEEVGGASEQATLDDVVVLRYVDFDVEYYTLINDPEAQ